MNLPQDIQELLEQYLNGQLKGQALHAFEARLKTDEDLAKEVAFQREMHLFLAETPENELRKTLQQLSLQVTDSPKIGLQAKWWSWLFPVDGISDFLIELLGNRQVRLAGLGAVLLMIGWWFSPVNPKSVTNSSIAILPFTEIVPPEKQAYFGDGFAEDILTTLTQVEAIKVAGQTASFSFKDKAATIEDIGDELAVTHVLKGSVSRQKKKIRVTAQLVKVADGSPIWTDSYDRELADIFDVRDELLENIAQSLLLKLAPEQHAKLRTASPTTGKVYDLFLEAKHVHKNLYKSSRDLTDFHKSEALFMEAIQLDPNYALAHAGLADLYDSYWVEIQLQEDNPDLKKYKQLMEQESELAVQLAPENAYVNQVRGYILHHLNQPEAAFQSFLKSYQISPNNPESMMGLSNLYLGMGLHEDALQLAEKAMGIDPLFKSAWAMQIYANFYLGRWEKTVDLCQSFLTIDANNQIALEYLFRAYFLLDQKEAALAVLPKIKAVEMLGLNLEIALLQADSSYIDAQLANNNPNLAFEIYRHQGQHEKAAAAYQQATNDYLKNTTLNPTIHSSLYLDHINNPRLKSFQDLDWFQKVLAFEKEKYEQLSAIYPRAAELLER